jgi:RNA methyltransferase, TrmH family
VSRGRGNIAQLARAEPHGWKGRAAPPGLARAKRLTKRAFRQRERTFLAEGPQAVAEALRCGAQVTDLFVTVPARSRHADLVTAAEGAGVPVHVVSGEVMGDLAQTVTPQGLLAVCGFVDVPLADVVSELKGAASPGLRSDEGATKEGDASRAPGSERENRVTQPAPLLVTLLANVRDPGNAGTVLRTADAAGVQAVVFADASVDPYNGKCVRASAGSLFHLPLVAGVRLEEAVAAMRGAGLRILAADGRAGRSLDDPDVQARLGEPTAWMFGNEAWGLPPDLVALADEPVAVPIYGQAESLNLAAAAAVCLYASARAQRVHSEGGKGRCAR